MPDSHVPVSLRGVVNATIEDVSGATTIGRTWGADAAPAVVALGRQHFRGLPFEVGANRDTGPQLLLLRPGSESVVVDVGSTGRQVVFAHRQLASRSPVGMAAGDVVATYELVAADGRRDRATIRERFEIQQVPTPIGYLPFLARPDADDGLLDRHEGPWHLATRRYHECVQGFPVNWLLWAWDLGQDTEVAQVVLHPGSQPVAVGAITISTASDLFVRTESVAVRIELPDALPPPVERPYEARVSVDRGWATHLQPLPSRPSRTPGWGSAPEPTNSAYTRIAAVPDATVTVEVGTRQVGSVRWSDVLEAGGADAGAARVQLVETGRNWVHVTVRDEDTGKPVPCRVSFTTPEGIPYQPNGHHDHPRFDQSSWNASLGGDVRLGDRVFAAIDGTCQGWLPRGEVDVEVCRGFEYEPLRDRVVISRGQRHLELAIRRSSSLRDDGWWSGDTHVHFLSPHGALHEQQAEDLNVVNLLQAQWGSYFSNTVDFTGRPLVSDDGLFLTQVSQESRQHVLGHLVMLGLQHPVVPWSTDGPSDAELGGTLDASMGNWADACRQQGGTVVLPHFPIHNGEIAALVATDRADAVEWIFHEESSHAEYYGYLNAGYRLPLVGGTDKMIAEVAVGQFRAYARIPDGVPFSLDAWRSAIVAGRTFMTSGPLLGLRVDGHEIGDTVHLGGSGTVTVEAWSTSIFPINVLEVVHDGQVVAREVHADGTRRLELSAEVAVDGPGWIAVRVGSGSTSYFEAATHPDGRGIHAHSGPIYLEVDGRGRRFDREQLSYMLTLSTGSLDYVRHTARHRDPARTDHWHGGDHLEVLTAPIRDAIARIEDRLDQGR